MARTILVAVDSSPQSQAAAAWAAANVARPGDALHLLAVAPPPSYTMSPAAPIASAGAVAALSINWEQQRKAEEEMCRQLLLDVAKKLPDSQADKLEVHRHVLPAAGGASGVAESVVAFAKERRPDLVVVGSRGMGAAKSALMSLVGLGSVSGYLVHQLHCPVAVCRGRAQDVEAKRKVLVSLDDSDTSKQALEWALANVVGPEDELHLVCVALPIPYPVSAYAGNHLPQPDVQGWRRRQRAALRQAEAVTHRTLGSALRDLQQVVAEDAVASEVLEADEFDAAEQDSISYAREIVTKAVDSASAKVESSRIFFKALAPEGGASDVGRSIVHYAQENGMSLVVLGARGMGSFKRAIMSFVGLGSVSDFVVAHAEAPICVVKQ